MLRPAAVGVPGAVDLVAVTKEHVDREPLAWGCVDVGAERVLRRRIPLHLVADLGSGDATRINAVAARFTSPVIPGETLTTSIWRTEPGHAVFRTEASNPDGSDARLVLEDGSADYSA
jgi:hypothetical protein